MNASKKVPSRNSSPDVSHPFVLQVFFCKFDSGQKGQAIRVTEAMKVMGAMRVTEAMMFMEALGVMEANKVTEAVRARKVMRVCVVWPKRARPCGSLRP